MFKFCFQILLLISLAISSFSTNANQPLDRVVATVNGDVITLSRLNEYSEMLVKDIPSDRLPPKDILKKQALNKLILDIVQGQIAKSRGIDVDSYTIDQYVNEMAQERGLTIKSFKDDLAKNNISYKNYRQYIKTEIINSRLQRQELLERINVSDTDVDSFLNSPAGQDQSGIEYKLSHILLSVPDNPTPEIVAEIKSKAQKIAKDLKNGGDFTTVAMKESQGQRALHGGDLGYRKLAQIPTIFVAEVSGMNINDVSAPIRSASGFHIIKLVAKRTGKQEHELEYFTRQILIKPSNYMSDNDVKAELLAIRQQIKNGEDFSKLASQKSEELSTSAKGGSMGWITQKAVLPEFYEEIAGLKVGELSEPFKTKMGWHLVEVVKTRSSGNSVEASRNKAYEELRNKKYSEAIMMWFKQIKNKATVDILVPEYA